jgi:uncharacterized protein YhaN
MENYMYFDDNELFEELVEQLKAKEYEIGVLNRCCEAYDMELQKARAETEQLKSINLKMSESLNNIAKLNEKIVIKWCNEIEAKISTKKAKK